MSKEDRDNDGVLNEYDLDPDNPKVGAVDPLGGAGTDTTSTSGKKTPGIVTSPTQEGTFVVPWEVDPKTGVPNKFVTRASAQQYLNRKSPEYKRVATAFSQYGGAITNTTSLAAFWKKLIDVSAKTSSTFDDLLNTYKAQYNAEVAATRTPTTSKSTYFSYTTKTAAYNEIDRLIKEKYGVSATAEQKKRYYSLINAGEKQGASITQSVTVGGQTTSTTTQNQFDKEQLKQETLENIIAAYNKKTPGAKLKGEAATIQDSLLSYANDQMGLSKGTREINTLVAKVIGGMNIQDAYKEIKADAVNYYGKSISERLKQDTPGDLTQGLTVRTLANPYISLMANVLELDPTDIKLSDNTISNMIGADKLPTLADARKTFRQDKRWNNTQSAVEESKQLGYSLLRAFGYGV